MTVQSVRPPPRWPRALRMPPPPPPILICAFALSVLFGVCLILNFQISGDGMWFLYAKLIQHGARLYTDLKSPLQPFHFLQLTWWHTLFGDSWVTSLIPAVVQLLLLSYGYLTLAMASKWSALEKSIVFLGSFFSAIGFELYEFGDYHVVTDIICLYVVIILLRHISRNGEGQRFAPTSLLLGVLCGLAFSTRSNDGALLSMTVAAISLYVFPGNRLKAILLIAITALLTATAVVLLTGDSISSYLNSAIFGATKMKGGGPQLFATPLILISNCIKLIFTLRTLISLTIVSVIVSGVIAVNSLWAKADGKAARVACLISIAVFLVVCGCLILPPMLVNKNFFLFTLEPFFIFLIYGFGLFAALVALSLVRPRLPQAVLMLAPLGALMAQAMSSAGNLNGIFAPTGLFLALAPICVLGPIKRPGVKGAILCVYGILAASVTIGKVQEPATWGSYKAAPMFVGREIIRHPRLGYMIVDARLDAAFSKICNIVKGKSNSETLFSTPYSYANYYCGIGVWQNNVETFYDISSKSTIDNIIHELGVAPPDWVLVERQPAFLRSNEMFYYHGGRAPQRDLYEFIADRVGRGAWKVALEERIGPDEDLVLIRTQGVLP